MRKASSLKILIPSTILIPVSIDLHAAGIDFSWRRSSDLITGYKLYYKQGGGGSPYDGTGANQGVSPIIIAANLNPRFTLSGLDMENDYEFTITAYRDEGGLEADYADPINIYSVRGVVYGDGAINPSPPFWLGNGKNKVIAFIPAQGYVVDNVIVNNESLGSLPEITLSDISASCTVEVHFTPADVDSDGDGLTDTEETHYNTDPYEVDSDGDGLSDSDEIYVYETDPNNPDSDGDGTDDYNQFFITETPIINHMSMQ